MPRAVITNRLGGPFNVPPPVGQVLDANESITVSLTTAQLQDPALTSLEAQHFITITVQNDPNASDVLEGIVFGVPYTAAVTTTDATVTPALTTAVATATVASFLVRVAARNAAGSEAAGYVVAASFRNDAGVVTQVGATTALVTHEDVGAWAVTFTISGVNVRVNVTGEVAKTIVWKVGAMVQTQV